MVYVIVAAAFLGCRLESFGRSKWAEVPFDFVLFFILFLSLPATLWRRWIEKKKRTRPMTPSTHFFLHPATSFIFCLFSFFILSLFLFTFLFLFPQTLPKILSSL